MSISSSATLAQNGQNWSLSPQMEQAFTLFDTVIGTCAIVWGAGGIVGVSLPSQDIAETRSHLRQRFPQAIESKPSAEIASVVADIQSLMQGEKRDLSSVKLDLTGIPDFHRKVYAVARAITQGNTMTYGEISAKLNAPGTARAVGKALGANPFPIIVPCHRILASGGKAGGFSAPGGLETKMRMLNIERANVPVEPSLFDQLPLAAPPRRSRSEISGRRR